MERSKAFAIAPSANYCRITFYYTCNTPSAKMDSMLEKKNRFHDRTDSSAHKKFTKE